MGDMRGRVDPTLAQPLNDLCPSDSILQDLPARQGMVDLDRRITTPEVRRSAVRPVPRRLRI